VVVCDLAVCVVWRRGAIAVLERRFKQFPLRRCEPYCEVEASGTRWAIPGISQECGTKVPLYFL
jgi:hypothetical protein